MKEKDWLLYFAGIFLISLTWVFGYRINQSTFLPLFSSYLLFFCAYVYIYRYTFSEQWVWRFLVLGLILRFMLIFALPNLSDDYYRFVWDGRLIANGLHPLAELPRYYLEQGVAGVDASLFEHLNSKEYFTVYPPVCQLVFSFSCLLFPNSVFGSVVVMKSVFFLFEVGSVLLLLKLLDQFRLPTKSVLLYALSPLVILESFGNLHFEIALVFFVLLSIYLLCKGKWWWSAIAIALGVASKLLPLMFLPFLIKRFGWRRSLGYFSICGMVILALFTPLLFGFVGNFGESLNLYFQRFEFNASFYYLFRSIGYLFTGFNLIAVFGPLLILIAAGLILRLAYKEVNLSMHHFTLMCLASMTLFLASTTTVHPWYLTSIVAFCVLTRFRFPILWSLLIMLTYANYSGVDYHEYLWIVFVEYLLVFGLLGWELKAVIGRK